VLLVLLVSLVAESADRPEVTGGRRRDRAAGCWSSGFGVIGPKTKDAAGLNTRRLRGLLICT
jgi:hypothetical protein